MTILDTILSDTSLPPVLYHYTSPDRFKKIIDSGHLRVSDIRYVENDISFSYTREFVADHLLRLMQPLKRRMNRKNRTDNLEIKLKLLNELKKRLASLEQFHMFVTSFSQDGDLGSSWRDYCPGSIGYSIGFAGDTLSRLAGQQEFRLVECIRSKSGQENIVSAIVSESMGRLKTGSKDASEWLLTLNTAADEFVLKTIQLAAVFQHPSSHERSAWRLFSMPVPILPTNSTMRFRSSQTKLVPYLEFMLSEKKGAVPDIRKVIIGPTPDPKLSRDSLELFMSANSLQSCVVHYSRVPYTGSPN